MCKGPISKHPCVGEMEKEHRYFRRWKISLIDLHSSYHPLASHETNPRTRGISVCGDLRKWLQNTDALISECSDSLSHPLSGICALYVAKEGSILVSPMNGGLRLPNFYSSATWQ